MNMGRKATPEQIAATQTPEYQAQLRELVAEPGQVSLALGFFANYYFRSVSFDLTPMELRILNKHSRPRRDWEGASQLWEEGDEVCAAYGNLTLRGLIVWELRTGKDGTWLVSEITDKGRELVS